MVGLQRENPFYGDDRFQACVDVHLFQPSEVTVKVVDGNTVVIEGKHTERDDGYGAVQRHFVRKYVIPKYYDLANIKSTLSSDKVLTVEALPVSTAAERQRTVPIALTNAPFRRAMK